MTRHSPKPADSSNVSRGGRVTLLGAGPGDPELLTLKAIRAMQEADVILFDALVSDEVLAFARVKAKRMLVGKRGHKPSCKQDDINGLMVKLARQGKNVVRLKAGDPSIFGRAGEEIEHLHKAGIPVVVVPGITSASAMAASLGVSLTHRDCAHAVRFVTGHARDGKLPGSLDWRGMADRETTLIIYMGGHTSQAFARRLIAEGLPASTPCVIAESVSRPDEKRHYGTLADLECGALVCACDEPVLIGVGAVFAGAMSASNVLASETRAFTRRGTL